MSYFEKLNYKAGTFPLDNFHDNEQRQNIGQFPLRLFQVAFNCKEKWVFIVINQKIHFIMATPAQV